MANGKPGRKAHEPNEVSRAAVLHSVGMGTSQAHIAMRMGISEDTLQKYYRWELDNGAEIANDAVAGALYKKAISDDHPQAAQSAMFWLKTRARWKETHKIEADVNHTVTKVERVIIENATKHIEHNPQEKVEIKYKPGTAKLDETQHHRVVDLYDETTD